MCNICAIHFRYFLSDRMRRVYVVTGPGEINCGIVQKNGDSAKNNQSKSWSMVT